jgi:hypothetical protein
MENDMSELTKGPWKAKQLATYHEPGWVVMWPDKGGAHMRRLDYQGNFTGADAAVIAAAKELLAACEGLVAWCDTNPPTGEALYFVQLARDAVAKARGA